MHFNDEYDETAPPRANLAGDAHDDDAQILDDLVESHAEPPTPEQRPIEPIAPVVSRARPITRLVTGSIALQKTWDPQLILPADPNRTSLQLWAASNTATDFARLADDAGKVQSLGACALLYSGMLLTFPLTAPGTHTGPVWVSCPDATGPVTVSFIAVTS